MNQKTLLSVAGLAGLALTAGLLIVNPLKSADEKLMDECLKSIPFVWESPAEAQSSCRINVDIQTGKLTKHTYKTPVESPVEAPVAAPVAAPAAVERTYSYEEAMTEACEAGRQYRNDVELGYMQTQQSFDEARSYAHHLSAQSAGVDNGVLYSKIKECMW